MIESVKPAAFFPGGCGDTCVTRPEKKYGAIHTMFFVEVLDGGHGRSLARG